MAGILCRPFLFRKRGCHFLYVPHGWRIFLEKMSDFYMLKSYILTQGFVSCRLFAINMFL